MTISSPKPNASFYARVDDSQRVPLLEEYIRYLVRRNGEIDPATGVMPLREAGLQAMNVSPVRYAGTIAQADFDRLYAGVSLQDVGMTPELLLLLTFCKMNAAEAYGVRVVRPVHARREKNPEGLAARVIRYAQEEEEYHTRILVGAAHYFGIRVSEAYRPRLVLKVLIHTIAYGPRFLFHPTLYASEVAGVYLFNWTLNRVRDFHRGQPELQDALAQRLIEILVDEIGHIAFNRLVLGERGRGFGRALSFQTLRGLPLITPELGALGFDRSAMHGFAAFDFANLPAEVRSRGFFA